MDTIGSGRLFSVYEKGMVSVCTAVKREQDRDDLKILEEQTPFFFFYSSFFYFW